MSLLPCCSYISVHKVIARYSKHWKRICKVRTLRTWQKRGLALSQEGRPYNATHLSAGGAGRIDTRRCNYISTSFSSAASPKEFTVSSHVGGRSVSQHPLICIS